MAAQFAEGTKAWGICDRCGGQYRLRTLRGETIRGRPLKNLVCATCWDKDHPQNWQGAVPVNDPQALRNPRPDPALAQSRQIPPAPFGINDIPKFN